MTGKEADPNHAVTALGYARLALSPLGIALYLGPPAFILIGFSIAMAALGIGPDTMDALIFVALAVFLAINHVRVANRVRDAANRIL
jgi:hypothetical protein